SGSSDKKERKYTEDEAYLLQQRAVECILGWIVNNAEKQSSIEKAQSQFEEICMCMNKFVVKPANADQKYCESRLALDNFMSEPVLSLKSVSG
ncbi:hypothetical protein, partial [Mesorhizobium japonicum]|uniref:hypothetical protein n=1 Tax=Mesorhizobium japonicum TaxID=2066070 RepID=UPI003B5BBF73